MDIRKIGFLLEKEFKQFIRDPFMSKTAFLMPFVMMLVMPVIAVMDVKSVNLAVVDSDHSTVSTQLVKAVASSDYFIVKNAPATYDEALAQMQAGSVDIILQIPYGVENDVMAGRSTEVFIAANAVNSTKGIIGSGHLNSVIAGYSADLANSGATIAPLDISVRNLYNSHLSYSLYMSPACLILIMIAICSFLPVMNIVAEKEKGTIEQINVTPVSKLEFIVSKLVFYGVIGLVMFTLSFFVGKILYGMSPYGGYGAIYLAAFLFILFLAGFGLAIANFSETLQQAVFLAFFFILLFVLLCGLFTPTKSMVPWAYKMTYALAPRYFIDIIRSVCLKGSTVSDLAFEYIMLTIFSLAMDGVAVLTYKKQS